MVASETPSLYGRHLLVHACLAPTRLVPTLPPVMLHLLAGDALSQEEQRDGSARPSCVTVMTPDEHAAAASVTTRSRPSGRHDVLRRPLVVAGVLKSTYDLLSALTRG